MSRTMWPWGARVWSTSGGSRKTGLSKSGRSCRSAHLRKVHRKVKFGPHSILPLVSAANRGWPMSAQLLIQRGLPPQAFPLVTGPGVIGRAPGSTIELQNPEVSRQHCRFTWDGQTLIIDDLNSARGTLVNGTRIPGPTVIRPGDEILLGPVALQLSLSNGPAPSALPQTPPSLPSRAGAERVSGMLLRGVATDRLEINEQLT